MTQPNPDDLLKQKLRSLRTKGATEAELRAFVDEWDRTRGTSAAPADRTDQTIRNPDGEDPLVRFGPTVAGLAVGGGVGGLAGRAAARAGASMLTSALASGAVGGVAGGAATRAAQAPSGERVQAALDPRSVALDATVGTTLGAAGAAANTLGSAVAKRLGLFRRPFAEEHAGETLRGLARRTGRPVEQWPQAAIGRAGPDALVLNAGEATADAARRAVRSSRGAHGAVLPALTRQQEGAKTRARLLLQRLYGPARGSQPEMAQQLSTAGREGAVPQAYERAWAAQPGAITDPVAQQAVVRGEAVLGPRAVASITDDLERLTPQGTFLRNPAGAPSDAQVAQWLTTTHGIPPQRITPPMIAQTRPIAQAAGVVGDPEVSLQYAAELKSRLGKAAKFAPPDEVQPTSTTLAARRTDEEALRTALHDLSPEYRAADELYATNKAQQHALDAGYKAGDDATSAQGVYDFTHTTRPNARPGSERLAQGAFRQGQRARYADRIEAASPGEDVVGRVFGSDAQQRLVRTTAQGNAADDLGPTLARERALQQDANTVGAPSDPGVRDVRLDPGEWSIRQGYVGNVLFPAADVAARIGKRNVGRVESAADDIVARLLSRNAADPQAAQALRDAAARALAVVRARDGRSRRIASLLASLGVTSANVSRE